jgi:radical SAM protein with 4Fe4S-binding SPASM domain
MIQSKKAVIAKKALRKVLGEAISTKVVNVCRILRRKITSIRNSFYIRRHGTPSPPIFAKVEIETVNRCNMTCSFCPVNKNNDTRDYKKMDERLFDKIINDLKAIDYGGKVGLYSNNEPFLDDRIVSFAEQARGALPYAYIYIFTNGTLLTLELFTQIIPYLDEMVIDNYNDDLLLNKTTQIIHDYCKNDPALNHKVHIRMRKVNEVLSTRGGQSPNKTTKTTVSEKCILPWTQLVIRPDGKISLCCNDVYGKYTLGDVNNNTLKEIWHSQEYIGVRNALLGGRQNIDLCKFCDTVN